MAFRMSLLISKAEAVIRFPYWHIDLNAGCGVNDLAGCLGSPLVFLREAMTVGRPVHAYFCERDRDRAVALKRRIDNTPIPVGSTTRVLDYDNDHCLRAFAETIRERERKPGFAMGTCVCDPNGVRDGFPVEALVEFLNTFPRIDLILNLNANHLRCGRALRRRIEAGGPLSRPCFKGFGRWPDLDELLPRFGRKYWLIRNPPRLPSYHFVLLVGRNKQTRECPFRRFHPLGSPVGQEILRRLAPVDEEQLTFSW
jgi:hypothetical protein